MATTPAALFSRLQLAAALLEYDNDPNNPDAPTRSAQDSAIFAHLRRNPAARPDVGPRKGDGLGVSESGSTFGRDSALDTRRSRGSKGSIDALRNPFPADSTSDGNEDEEEEEGLEVDLASWGLDAFMPKDKKSAKAKGKQPAVAPAVGSTRAHLPSTNYEPSITAARHGFVTSRSISLGGDIEANEVLSMDEHQRRRSFGSPLDLVGMEASGQPFHSRRRAASQASLTPAPNQPMMVPFPSGGSIRSPSPGAEQAYGEAGAHHNRTYSSGTMGSRFVRDETKNDPSDRPRTFSNDTLGMLKPVEDNPFAIQNPSHTSRFDPKAASRARSYSNATMGSRLIPENDAFSVVTEDPYARERRYSTLELLRPKVLVMPSPLQPVSTPAPADPVHKVRDGFELTTDGPPLPPGARASRRLSSVSLLDPNSGLVPSNSFTPTPFNDLTLSQKTFRSTLSVPGQSTPYSDFPSNLPRATEEGEQAVFDPAAKEEGFPIVHVGDPNAKTARLPGKLYGKSLIDDLEARKAQMRSKQRVFTGDQRPSMMARDSSNRVSTLIDPATLNTRPGNERTSSYGTQLSSPGANLARHPSLTMKPLITFDGDDGKVPAAPSPNASRLQGARSVFGVDTLWQREMEKLNVMKAAEEKENEERKKREEEEERKKQEKKNKRKKKSKDKPENEPEVLLPVERPASPRVSAEPPTLPNIERAPRRAPPKPSDSDVSSESDDDAEVPVQANIQGSVAWHSSDDEDDDGPRRTTGVGLRYPKSNKKMSNPPPRDEDSDEDLPLAATIQKARAKLSTAHGYAQDDSEDEDKPLSHILKAKSVMSISSNSRKLLGAAADEDEDDEPLGLRASRIPFRQMNGGEDEDDLPLALHPEQQRKSQFQMLAAQQQQQQMMMQAQFQSNMLMNTPMMAPNYYAPPMMNPMAMMQMMPPITVPSPPPIQDEVKYGRVDRWRRDVAVDGDTV